MPPRAEINAKTISRLRKRLIAWYGENQRKLPWRETDDPYRIWVSEVMLQQTQVNTVLPYYQRFFLYFPELKHLARADLQDVLKAWEGLGYYARARNLHRSAKIVFEKYGGKIPENPSRFRELPGVGNYIAAAVMSIAFCQPHSVVDGNVKRVIARLLQLDAPVNKSVSYGKFKAVSDRLLDTRNPGIFNQAMMELGALKCTPRKPDCSTCPIIFFCRAHHAGTVNEYPKRVKLPPTPEYHIAVGVVYKNGHVLITRRKSEGLLGGLWEFPGGKVRKDESAETACLREIKEEVNLSVEIASFLTRVKHAYTHFKVRVDVFCCKYIAGDVQLKGPVDYQWIELYEIEQYPFPKANHKFIPLLKETRCRS
ncbi:MAG: A/G-specific adenine glycosylase [Pseudomonadota bacterium]